MNKIKIFSHWQKSRHDRYDFQETINEWISKDPLRRIIQMTTSEAEEYLTITFLYEDDVEESVLP